MTHRSGQRQRRIGTESVLTRFPAENGADLDELNRVEAHVWLDGWGAPEGRVQGPVRDLFFAMNGMALRAADPGDDGTGHLPHLGGHARALEVIGDFLATIRADSGPRLHPMCPIVHDDRLLAFILPSPKLQDLRRDGRYAMHCFPPADNEDAFYVTGHARVVDDATLRAAVAAQFVAERTAVAVPLPEDDHALVEFDIDTVLLTRTTTHGDLDPQHTIWKAGRATP